MKLTLAINTASKESAIALLEEGRLLGEKSWKSEANESERVLPGLKKLLELAGKTWEEVSELFVVKGPGSYTSLRVGITIANAIAWILKIPMVSVDVFEVWESRIPANKRDEVHLIIMGGGRDLYYMGGEKEPRSWAEIEEMGLPCYGEFPGSDSPKQSELLTFGKAMEQIRLDELERTHTVEPLYMRPPDITPSKKTTAQ